MRKETGGSAFPVPDDANVNGDMGMDLRDYFAAKAMSAGIGRWGGAGTMFDEGGISHSMLAKESYQIADAMIAERAK